MSKTLEQKQKCAKDARQLEQKRAKDAWQQAQLGVREYRKDYVSTVKSLPALIMNSGLMQVMAFLEGKDKARHRLLAQQLRDWLHESMGTPKDFEGFMDCLLNASAREFQMISAEAFAWLKWLRHMAAAVHPEE